MSNASAEQIESEIISFDISDEALEAAGLVTVSGAAYTQFAYCTQFACPGNKDALAPLNPRLQVPPVRRMVG